MTRLPRRRLLFGLASLPAVAGCGGRGAGTAPDSVLRVATAEEVRSLDPALAFDTWSTAVVHACTRRLYDYDGAGRLRPDLAQATDVADNNTRFVILVRPGQKYADGQEITARDFRRALERVRAPETASPGAGFYSGVTSIEAPDAQTLVLRTSKPDPSLRSRLALTFAAPVPAGAEGHAALKSGPYRLAEEYRPGDTRIRLIRNPFATYAATWVPEIELQCKIDEALQLTRFRAGELDLLPGIPRAEYERVMADPAQRRNVVQAPVSQTWYFGMNVTHRPWNDVRVRRAARLAIRVQAHVELAGAGVPARGVLPPHLPGHDESRPVPQHDPEGARRLLAEAGFPDGIPSTLKSTMWLANSEQYLRHAQAIQSDLAAVGIPVDLRPVTFKEYLQGYRDDADCWYGGWYPDHPDSGNFLEPVLHSRNIGKGRNNAARFSDPRFDSLLDRAAALPPGPAQTRLYQEADRLLDEALPWIPLYYEVETRWFRSGVRGVAVDPVWRQRLTGISKG